MSIHNPESDSTVGTTTATVETGQSAVGRVMPWQETPNWYVTNGNRVVGPVTTPLLLRGIVQGRVDRSCYLAQHSWSGWRTQNQVREVRALRRWQYSQLRIPSIQPVERALRAPRLDSSPLELPKTGRELLEQALAMAVRTTRANVGVVHQPRPPHVGLVTSWTYGPGMGLNYGEVVPWHDEARAFASDDRASIGHPDTDGWARPTARRLTNSVAQRVSGVAIVPIQFGGARGLLELGRFDHGFRQSDVAVLEDLSNTVVMRLNQLAD